MDPMYRLMPSFGLGLGNLQVCGNLSSQLIGYLISPMGIDVSNQATVFMVIRDRLNRLVPADRSFSGAI